jgi:hypothetical protein
MWNKISCSDRLHQKVVCRLQTKTREKSYSTSCGSHAWTTFTFLLWVEKQEETTVWNADGEAWLAVVGQKVVEDLVLPLLSCQTKCTLAEKAFYMCPTYYLEALACISILATCWGFKSGNLEYQLGFSMHYSSFHVPHLNLKQPWTIKFDDEINGLLAPAESGISTDTFIKLSLGAVRV